MKIRTVAVPLIKALEEKNDGKFDYIGQNEETACAR